MAEDYVRPPIVAQELPSLRGSIWRFRIVMGALLLLLVLVIVLIAHAIVHQNDAGGAVGLQPQPLLTDAGR